MGVSINSDVSAQVKSVQDDVTSLEGDVENVQEDLTSVQEDVEDMQNDVTTHDDHFHTRERWLGAKAGWNGTDEVDEADPDSVDEFRLDAGNDDWGTALCVIGSGDTPIITGTTLYDLHRLLITNTERNEIYKFRLAWGTSYAAALLAGTYTEVVYFPISNKLEGSPVHLLMPKIMVGGKLFIAVLCDGQDTGWIDFLIGIHEYS